MEKNKRNKINYWFFTNISENEIEDEEYIINFKSKTNFKGRIDDEIIFLTYDKNGFYFSHIAKIGLIDKKELEKSEKLDISFYNMILKEVRRIEYEALLDNYIYSILRIKDFNNPEKYFKNPFGKLENAEYRAIKDGFFFIARTKFGKYVNALPKQHKLAFIKYFIEVNPDLYFNNNKNFNEALKILETYIELFITQPVRYMKEGYIMLSKLISEEELNNIGFSNNKNDIDYLKVQNLHFEKYINLIDNQSQEDKEDYESIDLQNDFQKLFNRTTWPIILN